MAAYWGLTLWSPMGSMMIQQAYGSHLWPVGGHPCAEQHLRIPSSSHDAAQHDVSSKMGPRAPPDRRARGPMVEAGGHCGLHRFRRSTVAGHLWNLDNFAILGGEFRWFSFWNISTTFEFDL